MAVVVFLVDLAVVLLVVVVVPVSVVYRVISRVIGRQTTDVIAQNPRTLIPITCALTFARFYAFIPRVPKLFADFICTLASPSATTTTATGFAGLEHAAFWTLRCCRRCFFRCV